MNHTAPQCTATQCINTLLYRARRCTFTPACTTTAYIILRQTSKCNKCRNALSNLKDIIYKCVTSYCTPSITTWVDVSTAQLSSFVIVVLVVGVVRVLGVVVVLAVDVMAGVIVVLAVGRLTAVGLVMAAHRL